MPVYDGTKVDYKKRKDKLPLLKKPIECTVVKIGKYLFVDPSLTEYKNVDARLTIAYSNGSVNAMQKGGEYPFSVEEVEEALKIAKRKTDEISKLLK